MSEFGSDIVYGPDGEHQLKPLHYQKILVNLQLHLQLHLQLQVVVNLHRLHLHLHLQEQLT